MRVVSWNMGLGPPPRQRHSRHDQAWHYLLGLGPDVAFLQEAFPPAWARREGTLVQGAITRWGSVIFSPRFPLERYRLPEGSHLRALGDYVAYGILTIPDGSEVFVSSVHAVARAANATHVGALDPMSMARPSVGRPWINDVVFSGLDELAPRPFLIAGDWNTARLWDNVHGGTAGAEFFDRADQRGWVECAAKLHGLELQTWFRGSDQPYQLDHVFCDAALGQHLVGARVANEAATELDLSDHAPLIVDFEVAPISMTSLGPAAKLGDKDRTTEP